MSLIYDDKKYIEGDKTYSDIMKILLSLDQNFTEYTRNANATEAKVAAISYDGVYLGIIKQIGNNINLLNEKLQFVKEQAENAKKIVLSYNNDKNSEEIIRSSLLELSTAYANRFNSSSGQGDTLTSNLNYNNIYKDGFMPQGITIVGNQVFVTAYSKDKNNSRIYVYENDQCQYKVVLDTNSHVGGITYDQRNHVILVTGASGAINAYSLDVMNVLANDLNKNKKSASSAPTIDLNQSMNSTIILNSNINMNYEQLANGNTTTGYNSATVYYDNETGKIYIARFSNNGKMIYGDAIYNPTSGTYNLENPQTADIDNGVQGINVYHRDGKTYLVESRSYGKNDGQITVRDITRGIENSSVVGSQKVNSYSEGIFTGKEGNSTIIYETGKEGSKKGSYNYLTETISVDSIIDNANGKSWDIEGIGSKYDDGDAQEDGSGYNTYKL